MIFKVLWEPATILFFKKGKYSMLIKLLPHAEKKLLLNLCKLLALSDNTLLWDGKTIDEVTSNTDFNSLSIKQDEQEEELIWDLIRSSALIDISSSTGIMTRDSGDDGRFVRNFSNKIEIRLIKILKEFPIHKVNMTENRISAVNGLMGELLEGVVFKKPEIPKIMLYELILVALKDGSISEVEMAFLKEFQQRCEIEEFIFDDILERAQALNLEMTKTLAIIYE